MGEEMFEYGSLRDGQVVTPDDPHDRAAAVAVVRAWRALGAQAHLMVRAVTAGPWVRPEELGSPPEAPPGCTISMEQDYDRVRWVTAGPWERASE